MAEQHPIEALMTTAMQSIREMVDVNTIVGDAVQSPDGTVIIPISKVTFGFAAGGGEYGYMLNEEDSERTEKNNQDDEEIANSGKFPFAGGSGAGVSISPVAFMVVGNGQIRLLPVNINSTVNKLLDLVPDLLCKFESLCRKNVTIKREAEKGKDKDKEKEKKKEEEE